MEQKVEYEKMLVNGVLTTTEEANSIMFVQCTLRGKRYTLDTSTSPISLTIEDYVYDGGGTRKDVTVMPAASRHDGDASPIVRSGKCGKCGKNKKV